MYVCLLSFFQGFQIKLSSRKHKQRHKETSHDDKVVGTDVSRQLPDY